MVKEHYETLGVPEDASLEDVKRAYRRKARHAHPDKGGSTDAMAALNRAYAVLGNATRRLRYDQGIEQPERTLAEEIRNELVAVFADMLSHGVESDCMGYVRNLVLQKRANVIGNQGTTRKMIQMLKRRRDRITTAPGVENVFQALVDQQLRHATGSLEQIEHTLQILDGALELLRSYRSIEDATKTMYLATSTTTWNP